MSWFSQFMHPGRGYKDAAGAMKGYYDDAQGYTQPYRDNGVQAGKTMGDAMGRLLNPVDLQNEWSQSYQTSDQAQQALANNREQGLGAASSMGLMGSSSALRGIQGKAGEIQSADKQQYMNDLMQKYMQGTGLAQNMYGVGAGAAGQAGQNATNMGQNAGQMAYGQSTAGGDMFGKLLGAGLGGLGVWNPWQQGGR